MTERTPEWAWDSADRAMADGGCVIRLLRAPAEIDELESLFSTVWATDNPPLRSDLMIALAHEGGYVAGAFDAGEPARMLGGCVGFFGPPVARAMHSHIAGVLRPAAGRGVGVALKRHQRAWCLASGIETMTWTFDPAISRNAHFNLVRLGARIVDYLPDFYGPMDDGINAGSPSDRALLSWDLREETETRPAEATDVVELIAVDGDGIPSAIPVPDAATSVTVQLPPDVERLRRARPEIAARWRSVVRDTLHPLIDSPDWSVAGFTRGSAYLLERGTS